MVGTGIEISEDSKRDLFEQIKSIFTEIESHKIDLKLDTKVLDEIKTVKSAIDTLQEQKNIELNLQGLEKIQNDFKLANSAIDSFKEQLKSITKSNDISIKLNDEQAIATIKTLEGQIEKLKFDIKKSDNGTITGFTLNQEQPVQSIVDKSDQVEQKQAIQQQNDLYTQASKLLREKYQLINAINDAEKKGYSLLTEELKDLQKENQLNLDKITPKLNETNSNSYNNQETELIEKKRLADLQDLDVTNQQNKSIEKQIELYKEQMQIKLQNLNTSGGDALKNEGVQSEIEAIKNALNGLNVNNYEDNVKKINNQLKQTQANVREINTESSKASGFFSDIAKNTLKFAQWSVSATILMTMVNSFKDMVSYTTEVDKSITNIEMITDKSYQSAKGLTDQYRQLALQMGQNDSDFLKSSEDYLRAGLNNQDTKKMLQNNAVASSISGVSNADMQNNLQTMKDAFGLTVDQVSDLIDKISTLDNKSSASFAGITEAMQRSAAGAKQVGVQYDKLAAMITTVESVSHRTASTVGQSFQSIFSRLENMSAGKSEDDTSINDVEKVLGKSNVEISLRSTSGEWKNMGVVIDEVAKKWKNLDSVTQSQIATTIAGKQQMSTFLTLMQNYDKEQQYEKDEANSSGSAMKKYNDYLNSIEAKTNEAKTSMHTLFSDVGNSDVIKGVVSAFTGFINTLDYIIKDAPLAATSLGLLTAAFIACATAMKTGSWTSIIGQFSNFKTAFMADAAEMGTMTTGIGLLKNGFSSLLEVGGSVISKLAVNPLTWIVGGIALITSLTEHMKDLKDATNTATSTIKDLNIAMKNQDLSGIQSGLSAMQQEQQKLNDMKEKADKYNTITGFIFGGLNGSANDYADYKQRLKADEQGGYKINSSGQIDTSKYDKEEKSLKQLQSVTNELSNSVDTQTSKTAKLIQQYVSLSSNTDKTKSQQKEQASVVNQLQKIFGDLSVSIDKQGNVTVKNIDTLKNHADALNSDSQAAEKDKQEQDALAKTMTDSMDNIKEYSKYIKDANENSGHFSSADIDEILKKHSELIPYLNNEPLLYQKIQEAIQKEKDSANDAYQQMMMNNKDYYAQNSNLKKVENDEIDALYKNYSQYFTAKADDLKKDINNSKTAAEAELKIDQDLNKKKAQADEEYYKAKGDAELKLYGNPLQAALGASNGKSISQQADSDSNVKAKKKVADDYADKIKEIEKEYNDAVNKQIQIPDVIDSSDATSEGLNKTTNSLKEQKQQAEQDKLEMKDYNNELNALKLTEKAVDDALQNTNQHSQEAINLLRQKADLIKQEIQLTEQQIKTQEALAQAYSSGGYSSGGSSSSGGNVSGSGIIGTEQAIASQYGVNPALMIAQAIQESGNGTSYLARTDNNLFGMTWTGSNGQMGTARPEGGHYVHYNSVSDSIAAYAKLLAGWGATGSFDNALANVVRHGYAADPNYENAVRSIYNSNGLSKYNTSSSADSALENQKNAEQANANALQLKGSLLDLQQTLKEIPFQEFQANLGIIDDTIESLNNQVNIVKDTITNFSDSLSHQTDIQKLWEQGNVALVDKAKELQQEYNYVQSQMNTSGYTDADYAQMKLKLSQIQDDMVTIRGEEDELAQTWINTITSEYEYEINYQDKLASRYETAAEVMKNNYSEVAKYRQMTIDDAMKQHNSNVAEENWLSSQINSGRFDQKTVEYLTEKLRTVQDNDLQLVTKLQQDRANLIDAQFDVATKQYSDNIDKLKASVDLMTKIGVENNGQPLLDTYNDLITNQEKYREGIESTISSIKEQMNILEQAGQQGGNLYVMYKDELDKYTKDLQTANADIQDIYDNLTNAMLTEQTSAWDKIKKTFDRNISDMENSLDKEQTKLTWMEQQQDSLSNKADLQKQLTALSADTSGANVSKIRDLQKQIVEANKTQTKNEVDHRISTEKQGLEDLKNTRDQEITDAEDQIKDAITASQKQLNQALVDSGKLSQDEIKKLGDLVQTELVDKIQNINDIVKNTVALVNNNPASNPFDLQSYSTSNDLLKNLQTITGTNLSKSQLGANVQYTPVLDSVGIPKTINNRTDNSKTIGKLNLNMLISKEVTQSPETLATYMINGIKKKGYSFNSK